MHFILLSLHTHLWKSFSSKIVYWVKFLAQILKSWPFKFTLLYYDGLTISCISDSNSKVEVAGVFTCFLDLRLHRQRFVFLICWRNIIITLMMGVNLVFRFSTNLCLVQIYLLVFFGHLVKNECVCCFGCILCIHLTARRTIDEKCFCNS